MKDEIRGCISVKKEHNTIFNKAYGYRDEVNKIANDIDTKFAIASGSKVFVAVAILQLIEKKLLKFDDTIDNFVSFELNLIDPKITIEQLLTHTSGIPDYFDENIMEDYEQLWEYFPNYKIRKSSDLIPLFNKLPMTYQKGTKFEYNNTGFVVLGLIIENIAKMPFDDYIKINVFDTCNMMDTGYYELDRLVKNCANNYIFDEVNNVNKTNIYSVDVKGTGAGGAFTTVKDIQNFCECLFSYKLLSKDMTKQMLSCHVVDGDDNHQNFYGLGIWLNKIDENTFNPYFEGMDPGVSFICYHDIKINYCYVLISNYCDNVWKALKNIREKIKKTNSYEV